MGLGQEKLDQWLLGVVDVNLYMGESTLGQCFLRKLQKLQQVLPSYGMLFGSGIWEAYCSYLFYLTNRVLVAFMEVRS